MKVVISGITSMLGLATAQACLDCGWDVVGLSRKDTQKRKRIPSSNRIKIVDYNLESIEDIQTEEIGKCDVFYHFAWEHTVRANRNSPLLQQKNIGYSLDALSLAARLGCETFIGAGSQAEYGWHQERKTRPDSPAAPVTAYGISKYAAGRLCALEAERLGLRCVWVRVFSVYGENDHPGTMVSSSISKLIAGEHCAFTPGTHLWDYLYSADAGEAFRCLGQYKGKSRIYCLGSGEARPLVEYIKMIRDAVCPDAELGIGEIPYPAQGGMNMCADISDLAQDIGWSPKYTFEEGIQKIVERRMNEQSGKAYK